MNPFDELAYRLTTTGFLNLSHSKSKDVVKSIVLGMPTEKPTQRVFRSVFPDDYEAGTFTVGERRGSPPFIAVDDKSSYNEWVLEETQADMDKILPCLEKVCPSQIISPDRMCEIPEKVLKCLDHIVDKSGRTLSDEVFQQEYTDVLRRLNLIHLVGWPRLPFNEYDEVNDLLLPVGIELVKKVGELDLSLLLRLSVASGLVGLNFKRNASATSVIHSNGVIPVFPSESVSEIVHSTYLSLLDKANEGWKIGFETDFFKLALSSDKTRTMIFFTDDYIESIFDLKLTERLLDQNNRLTVRIIPRAIRCGNDASYQDILSLLSQQVFSGLKKYAAQGRLVVEPMGPLSGNVNGFRLSNDVMKSIYSADFLMAKGARSYECLQGIRKPSFFSFAVCRSISECVTGIEAETGGLVLIYQEPGSSTFGGFRRRHLRQSVSSGGRQFWLSEYTVLDHVKSRENKT